MSGRFEKLIEAFPDTDTAKGIAYCSGSEDFYAELLCDLAASGKRNELQEAYDKKDWELYAVKAHALKGAAKTLGLESIRAVSEKLQNAAENEDTDNIGIDHKSVCEMLEKLALLEIR